MNFRIARDWFGSAIIGSLIVGFHGRGNSGWDYALDKAGRFNRPTAAASRYASPVERFHDLDLRANRLDLKDYDA